MPRRPLETISANIPRGEELTPYTRSKITTLHEDGGEIRDILRRLEISENTIKYIIKADSQHSESNIIQRMGRSKKYTHINAQNIVRFIQIHSKFTYADIHQNLHIYLSYNTLGHILDSADIKN